MLRQHASYDGIERASPETEITVVSSYLIFVTETHLFSLYHRNSLESRLLNQKECHIFCISFYSNQVSTNVFTNSFQHFSEHKDLFRLMACEKINEKCTFLLYFSIIYPKSTSFFFEK